MVKIEVNKGESEVHLEGDGFQLMVEIAIGMVEAIEELFKDASEAVRAQGAKKLCDAVMYATAHEEEEDYE